MSGEAINQRDVAVQIVRKLRDAGHVAYLAGGCVRDTLLGLSPKDYDVATDAPPKRVGEVFRHCRFVGESFGVVLVHLQGQAIEVSTFRADWGYSDGRRPDKVSFTDAHEDAQRRDFTINGLFEDPLTNNESERIIDYVGGRSDLKQKTIRAIGKPQERFREDYLRMLRAVRFAARLGFEIEEHTALAIHESAGLLGQISRERIGQEIGWMLTPGGAAPTACASKPLRALQLLQALGLDAGVLAEPPQPNCLFKTVERLMPSPSGFHHEQCLGEPSVGYATILVGWVLDRYVFNGEALQQDVLQKVRDWIQTDGAGVVRSWRKSLCLSNEVRDEMLASLRVLRGLLGWEELTLCEQKRLLASAGAMGGLALLGALPRVEPVTRVVSDVLAKARVLLQEGVKPEPFVAGSDLIELGIKPGVAFGRLLDETYDAQLEGVVGDRAEALQWLHMRCQGDMQSDKHGNCC